MRLRLKVKIFIYATRSTVVAKQLCRLTPLAIFEGRKGALALARVCVCVCGGVCVVFFCVRAAVILDIIEQYLAATCLRTYRSFSAQYRSSVHSSFLVLFGFYLDNS